MNLRNNEKSRPQKHFPPQALGIWGCMGWVMCFLFFSHPPALSASVPSLFSEANAAYYRGQYPQAEVFYLQAGQQDPQNPGAFYGAALCEYLLKYYSTAESNLKKALRLNPNLQDAQELMKRVQEKIQEQEIQDIRFLLSLKEGVMFYRMHQYGKARDMFLKAQTLNPDSEELHFNLGLTYMKLNEWDKAEAELRECLKLKPDDLRAEYALGVLYEKVGGTAEAQNYFLSVAQSPSAGLYNMEAMLRLSTLKSISPSPFHFSIRLQGGGNQTTWENMPSLPGFPPSITSGANQYGHLQLGYSPMIGKTVLNFSYGLDGIWSESPGQSTAFTNFHDFSLGSQVRLPSNWSVPFSYDEQLGLNSSGTLFYEHHQGSLGIQWLFHNVDSVQFQAQYLREIFLPPVNVGTNNWIGSVSSSLIVGSSHYFSLSYSFRQCLADTASTQYYDFYLHSLSFTYHVELGGGWNASLNYTPQWQSYPYFYDTQGTPRSDWIQNASAEVGVPFMDHWNFVLGDQFQEVQSTYSFYSNHIYSQHGNNYYAATQIFF